MNDQSNKMSAYLLPFAAGLSIAVYFLFGEHLSTKIDAFVISSLVTFFSGVLLLIYYALKYPAGDIKKVISQEGFYLLVIGLFLCAGYFLSFLALNKTTATSVTIFTAVEPVICIVFAYFGYIVPKEPLGKRTLLLMAALVVSVVISKLSVGTGESLDIMIGVGELLAVLSALAFAFAILVSKRVLQSDAKKSIIVVGAALTLGGILLMGLLLATGKLHLPTEPVTYLYLLGTIFFVALSWLFFYISLASRLGAALTEVLYQSKILFVFLLSLAASHLGLLTLKVIRSPLISFIGIILIITFSILLIFSHNKDMD